MARVGFVLAYFAEFDLFGGNNRKAFYFLGSVENKCVEDGIFESQQVDHTELNFHNKYI